MKRSQDDLLLLIQDIINEIEENLDSPLSVKDFASRSGYSIWQFQRIFHSMVGETIGNYLRARKLTRAAEKLINTDTKILDIALDFQFSSQEAFSRAFKNHFGKTPKKVRDEKPNLGVTQKPKITIDKLRHYNGGIETQPKIITIEEMKYVGLEIDMPSHLDSMNNNLPLLMEAWFKFNKLKQNIKNRVGKTSFGIAKSEGKFNEENLMRYLCAVEVENFEDISSELSTYTIPKTTFAIFLNKGLGDKTVHTITYIYGTWLPQSDYKRGAGDDLERFDHRFDMNSDDSVSEYFIPIERL